MPATLVRRKTGTVRPMAQTIVDVVTLQAPDVLRIMNLEQPMTEEFVLDVVYRGLFGYRHRSPVALCSESGEFVGNGTDFDLLSMMFALAERGAVVRIDEYRRIHPTKPKPGERRVRDGLRFGHIVGPVSNARTFAFSLRINDCGVLAKGRDAAERVGSERTYAFTTPDGLPNGQGGVIRVQFVPDCTENGWLVRNGVIYDGEALSFDDRNVVHVNRRQALGAPPYLVMKLLLDRLKAELLKLDSQSGHDSPVVKARPEAIFQSVLEHPDFWGRASVDDGLAGVSRRQYELRKLIQLVQFVTRADELAYWLYGYETRFVNQWLSGSKWRSWALPSDPSDRHWRRLDLGKGFALWIRAQDGS